MEFRAVLVQAVQDEMPDAEKFLERFDAMPKEQQESAEDRFIMATHEGGFIRRGCKVTLFGDEVPPRHRKG